MKEVREAARALSLEGRIWFSPRNLFYELARREGRSSHGRPDRVAFRRALSQWQVERGPLDRMVSARAARQAAGFAPLPDVLDYAVRRVIAFDRLETLLVFAKNLFHLKIEVALVGPEDFPAHVTKRLRQQLAEGLTTTVYTVHDATPEGRHRVARVVQALAPRLPRVVDVGLTLDQARERATQLTVRGDRAHLEELVPVDMMRFVYRRIARSAEDIGFG